MITGHDGAGDAGMGIGMDSLLDTITNAAGALIVMLATCYIGVRATVDVIRKVNPSTAPSVTTQVHAARAQLRALEADALDLRWQLAGEAPVVAIDDSELARMEQAVADMERSIMDISGISPETLLALRVEMVRSGAEIRQIEDEMDRLQRELTKRRELGQPADIPRPRVSVANVPDPMPAPSGARRLVLLCRYGRVVAFDEGRMEQVLHAGVAEAVKGNGGVMDFEKVASFFKQVPQGDDRFRWALAVERVVRPASQEYLTRLRGTVIWSSTGLGESMDALQKENSDFQKLLTEAGKKPSFLRFMVWGDSFPEYVVARDLAQAKGIPSGWVPQMGDADWAMVASSPARKFAATPSVVTERRPISPGMTGVFSMGYRAVPSLSSGAGGSYSISLAGGSDFVD